MTEENHPQSQSVESRLAESPTLQPTPAWRTLLAPSLGVFRPARAAQLMADSTAASLAVGFMLHVLMIAAAIVLIAMWAATEEVRWNTPASGLILGAPMSQWLDLHRRSMTEVWNDWHAASYFGPAEYIFMAVLFLVPLLAAVCAWVHLPTVHRRGSLTQSYRRAFCGVAACVDVLLLASIAGGVSIAWASRMASRRAVGPAQSMTQPEIWAPLPFFACIVAVLWIVGRAVRGVAQSDGGVSVHPRCEACGYDLTHVGQDNRCPECGADAQRSLTPNGWRPGCVWEQRGGLAGWLVTSVAVLFGPRRFYSRLKLRTPDAQPRIFAAWHYLWIAVAAGFWGYVIMMKVPGGPPPSGALFVVPGLVALSAVCLAWGVRRLAAGIAASWLLYTEGPNGVPWLARVIDYEIPYLWLFCLFNGLGITAVVAVPGFGNVMVFQRAFFWMPLGPPLVIFGNIALGLLWLWRYRIAARAVRWSNF